MINKLKKQEELLLNRTSVMRVALVTLYEEKTNNGEL